MSLALNLYLPEGWKSVQFPPSLFRRFEFANYAETRAFLDALAKLSEECGLYPDLGFGRTFVNVTVHGGSEGQGGVAEVEFAGRVGALAPAHHL